MGRISRRTLLAGAGFGTAALMLPGCSNPGTDRNTLNVLMGVNSQFPEQQQAWFGEIGAAFRARTGATIQWETFASANDELTRMQTAVISAQGPDVYSLGTTFTPTAFSTGAFVNLGDAEWDKLGGRDKWVPATLGISGPDESRQIGIPFVSRPFIMAYNTELLADAGIEAPARTWDELTEHAKRLTGAGRFGLAVAYKDNFDPWKFVWGMSIQAGNPLVEGDRARIDDPITARAYATYFGWLTRDRVVDPASVGWANTQAVAAFAAGKAGYFPMTSPLSALAFDKSPVKGRYAFALMPTVPPGARERPPGAPEAASILSGDNLVVADYSLKKDLAFEFVAMITDESVQTEFYKTFGQLPANAAAAKRLSSDTSLRAALQSANKSVATPFTGAWSDVQLALTDVVVQSIPDLDGAGVSEQVLTERLAAAQDKAQSAVERAEKRR
jgi:multiple sugar transport system substrate-binding protein